MEPLKPMCDDEFILMENPPDLIVINRSDEQNQIKKSLVLHNTCQTDNAPYAESSLNFRLNKNIWECQSPQGRSQLATLHVDEFDEQRYLLQQRFQDEIQSITHRHTESIQCTVDSLSTYVTSILQRSIEDIESLRLLHHKELCTCSKTVTDCIQQQSSEMKELCHHLIDQQHKTPMNLFDKLTDDFRDALNELKTSFDSKVHYLNDIHSSVIEKLNTKHETETNELKCELSLMSNRSN